MHDLLSQSFFLPQSTSFQTSTVRSEPMQSSQSLADAKAQFCHVCMIQSDYVFRMLCTKYANGFLRLTDVSVLCTKRSSGFFAINS